MSLPCLRLAAVRLSSLSRSDGSLIPGLPVTIVSLQRQLRFESSFGRLASGPLSALFLPAGFRVRLVADDDMGGVFALSVLDDAVPRNDLLPSRTPIAPADFDALLACERDVPWVREVGGDATLEAVLGWLRQDAQRRNERCAGRLVSRTALKAWIGEVTDTEDALIGWSRGVPGRESALPAALARPASIRRFTRVTGFGPRHYAREYHRRTASG